MSLGNLLVFGAGLVLALLPLGALTVVWVRQFGVRGAAAVWAVVLAVSAAVVGGALLIAAGLS